MRQNRGDVKLDGLPVRDASDNRGLFLIEHGRSVRPILRRRSTAWMSVFVAFVIRREWRNDAIARLCAWWCNAGRSSSDALALVSGRQSSKSRISVSRARFWSLKSTGVRCGSAACVAASIVWRASVQSAQWARVAGLSNATVRIWCVFNFSGMAWITPVLPAVSRPFAQHEHARARPGRPAVQLFLEGAINSGTALVPQTAHVLIQQMRYQAFSNQTKAKLPIRMR